MKKVALLILIVSLHLPIAVAHPGRTASDGCHYCRTNCDSWGEAWNQRHCHGGASTASYTTPKYTAPSCPSNSYYSNTTLSCVCNQGYAPSLNGQYCVKIPENAHVANNLTDVWLCDLGYQEVGNSCLPVVIEETPKIEEKIKTSVLEAREKPESEGTYIETPNNTNSQSSDETAGVWLAAIAGGGYLYSKYKKK